MHTLAQADAGGDVVPFIRFLYLAVDVDSDLELTVWVMTAKGNGKQKIR
jgi:hypothetical protein